MGFESFPMPAAKAETEKPDEQAILKATAEWFRKQGIEGADSEKPETLIQAYEALKAQEDLSPTDYRPESHPFEGAPLGLERAIQELKEASGSEARVEEEPSLPTPEELQPLVEELKAASASPEDLQAAWNKYATDVEAANPGVDPVDPFDNAVPGGLKTLQRAGVDIRQGAEGGFKMAA